MRCIYCNCEETKVIDSRPAENNSIRRRRECPQCGKRFTTYEKVESTPVLVVKKDGGRQLFDPEKIKKGIIKACEKRPVTMHQIEELIGNIERQAQNAYNSEISSQTIGEMVMKGLKELDQVSYVRFASVYRQFEDIESFMTELERLRDDQ